MGRVCVIVFIVKADRGGVAGAPTGTDVAQGILVRVDDHQRGSSMGVGFAGSDIQLAEAAPERQMLRQRHVSIAHEEHEMHHPGVADRRSARSLAAGDTAHRSGRPVAIHRCSS